MRTRRPRRLALTVMLLAAVTMTTAGATRPDPYGAPAPLPALSAATLEARYSAARQEIQEALATAGRAHDRGRVAALSALSAPGRRFLSFDPRGAGQAVEVSGELLRARRVAIVVPGADGSLTGFDSWKFAGGGARALYAEAGRIAPGTRLAVIAWLGYASPSTLSTDVLTDTRAAEGARGLRRFVGDVRGVAGPARIALLCHSYGSVVCGKAVPGLPVDDLALYGSPGTTASSAAGLRTPARVWAALASGDWITAVPNARFLGMGFGADPVSPGFGARVFDAGSGGHGEYLEPGSRSLHNLALIALGRAAQVTRA